MTEVEKDKWRDRWSKVASWWLAITIVSTILQIVKALIDEIIH